MLHQVGDLFELNVKLRCQKVKVYVIRAMIVQVYVFWDVTPCSLAEVCRRVRG